MSEHGAISLVTWTQGDHPPRLQSFRSEAGGYLFEHRNDGRVLVVETNVSGVERDCHYWAEDGSQFFAEEGATWHADLPDDFTLPRLLAALAAAEDCPSGMVRCPQCGWLPWDEYEDDPHTPRCATCEEIQDPEEGIEYCECAETLKQLQGREALQCGGAWFENGWRLVPDDGGYAVEVLNESTLEGLLREGRLEYVTEQKRGTVYRLRSEVPTHA